MRPLRVAWDNSLSGRDKGGTGVYSARLLEQFRGRKDVSLEVLQGGHQNSSANSVVSRGWGIVGNLFWTHTILPRILRKLDADLLHAPAFIAPLVAPCPVVMTVHDISYLLYPSHFSRWWGVYLKAIMPQIVSSAAAIVCVSEHSKQDAVATYKLSSHKVYVVPNGVDHERFHPRTTLDCDWARSFGIREGYLLHVGAFSYRKNIPVLLRAVADLRSKGILKKRQLVLAGPQDLALKGAHEVFETIQKLDLSSSVVLTGHVPAKHLPGLYRHAALLVMPSLYEGFGLPVLEAMAVGTPVVASNSASLPEVAGGAAILFPAQDHCALAGSIEEVLENRSIFEELQWKGLQRARQFSWGRAAEETIAVYRAVAGF
jgi:glycosyltransferase involved in cell wall biosynthesis